MNLDKEQEKLADLEFEYNVARISNQPEEIQILAKGRYKRQFNKVLRLQKARSNEKKEQDSGIVLEELI